MGPTLTSPSQSGSVPVSRQTWARPERTIFAAGLVFFWLLSTVHSVQPIIEHEGLQLWRHFHTKRLEKYWRFFFIWALISTQFISSVSKFLIARRPLTWLQCNYDNVWTGLCGRGGHCLAWPDSLTTPALPVSTFYKSLQQTDRQTDRLTDWLLGSSLLSSPAEPSSGLGPLNNQTLPWQQPSLLSTHLHCSLTST